MVQVILDTGSLTRYLHSPDDVKQILITLSQRLFPVNVSFANGRNSYNRKNIDFYSFKRLASCLSAFVVVVCVFASLVPCFPALLTDSMFSRAFHGFHAFPRLSVITCFTCFIALVA